MDLITLSLSLVYLTFYISLNHIPFCNTNNYKCICFAKVNQIDWSNMLTKNYTALPMPIKGGNKECGQKWKRNKGINGKCLTKKERRKRKFAWEHKIKLSVCRTWYNGQRLVCRARGIRPPCLHKRGLLRPYPTVSSVYQTLLWIFSTSYFLFLKFNDSELWVDLVRINHGLRDRLPYRCGVVRHVRLSCSWGCSAVDVEHATSDHFLQPKGKLNAHHVVLFLFLPSLGVKSSTTMPFFHVFFVFGAPFATDYGACRTNSNALASATYSFVCSQQ